ncbi:MAG: hypothetical protein L6R42_002863 [Xanthoria sp. 1 TBL-2021]|nr:MAG: hypothetical protein L6R42_002863 [Xanthoria sp. 1 TBL-2021]
MELMTILSAPRWPLLTTTPLLLKRTRTDKLPKQSKSSGAPVEIPPTSSLFPGNLALMDVLGAPTSAALSEFLKKVLYKNGIPFTVAPYSALAQLAYFEKHPDGFIDAIYGPAELFLYGVDKIITKFKLAHQPHDAPEKGIANKAPQLAPEISEFLWIDRRSCLEALGRISPTNFEDALLLAGSKILSPFPPTNKPGKIYPFRDTASLLAVTGGGAVTLCNQNSDDEEVQRLEYLDRYKRALAGIRHHVVITSEGDIETLAKDNAPDDLHDCVGQRLPEELNMYLSRGMIRPRVLNWLASGTILIPAPYDGGDSKVYQNLVRHQLEPLRRQTLSLLADSLNRYYQRKEITTKYWFDPSSPSSVNIKDLLPSPKDSINSWNVKENAMADRRQTLGKQPQDLPLGSISFAVRSLRDADFAAATITPPKKGQQHQLLQSRGEICANAVWRFLQLRGYVDRQHQLTAWGKVLDSILSIAGSQPQQEKAGLLAVELIRFGLLNADTMFSAYSGAPGRSNDIDKRNCMLASRVACLGRLIHQPRGYSGPLSRHLLAYHSMVSAVQASMRDMLEICLVTMFLEGGVNREREDWMEIALMYCWQSSGTELYRWSLLIRVRLPLFDEDSCALGVIILHYLDELFVREDPTSETTREEMTSRGQGWVIHSDFKASQQLAYQLWDAVYQGVKVANESGEEVKDFQMWHEVDQWLVQRRNPGYPAMDRFVLSITDNLSLQYRNMARLSYLLLSSLVVLGADAASSVLDLIPSNFDSVVLESGKPALVEFFAPWCGHCKNLAPVYEELAQHFDFAKDKVVIGKVDADEHKDLGRKFGVQGFPTLKWFDGKSDNPEDYNGGRDLESLSSFVSEKIGVKPKAKKAAQSAVAMLNDQTFKQHIGGDKDVLVAFTAPWCGHCKSLAPIWEAAATDYAAEPNIVIAKVDAEAENSKSTAEAQGVKSYPTIKYFPKGSTTPEPYEGGRSEKNILEFMNLKAGTHRTVGGGLDAKAGVIISLDAIVGKLSDGGNLASVSQEVVKAAKDLKDKYADYYVKVLGKLSTSQGYAEKELGRLEGLIKKGGLAPEKLDDLVSRSNILRTFTGKRGEKEEL